MIFILSGLCWAIFVAGCMGDGPSIFIGIPLWHALIVSIGWRHGKGDTGDFLLCVPMISIFAMFLPCLLILAIFNWETEVIICDLSKWSA